MTRDNYIEIHRLLRERGIVLMAMTYPLRPLDPMRWLLDSTDGVLFVDHEERFRRELQEHGYRALFVDHCNGDSGHATPRGNRILADEVATAILRYTEP